MYGLKRIAWALLALAVATLAAWLAARSWHPSVERYPVQGVDVSEVNGAIEWPVVAGAGADFAYAVATHGAGHRDARFEENWEGIAAAGMRRGAVHVWSMCQKGEDQANAFNTMVPRDAEALPAAIDLDYAEDCASRPERDDLIRELSAGATMIEAHIGMPVLLRISRRVEQKYDLTKALPRSLWATGNFLSPGYGSRPWRMWRANDMRRIDGAGGPINWNVAAP